MAVLEDALFVPPSPVHACMSLIDMMTRRRPLPVMWSMIRTFARHFPLYMSSSFHSHTGPHHFKVPP